MITRKIAHFTWTWPFVQVLQLKKVDEHFLQVTLMLTTIINGSILFFQVFMVRRMTTDFYMIYLLITAISFDQSNHHLRP